MKALASLLPMLDKWGFLAVMVAAGGLVIGGVALIGHVGRSRTAQGWPGFRAALTGVVPLIAGVVLAVAEYENHLHSTPSVLQNLAYAGLAAVAVLMLAKTHTRFQQTDRWRRVNAWLFCWTIPALGLVAVCLLRAQSRKPGYATWALPSVADLLGAALALIALWILRECLRAILDRQDNASEGAAQAKAAATSTRSTAASTPAAPSAAVSKAAPGFDRIITGAPMPRQE